MNKEKKERKNLTTSKSCKSIGIWPKAWAPSTKTGIFFIFKRRKERKRKKEKERIQLMLSKVK